MLLYNGGRPICNWFIILSEITLLKHYKTLFYDVGSENVLLKTAFADETYEDLPVHFDIFVKIPPIREIQTK